MIRIGSAYAAASDFSLLLLLLVAVAFVASVQALDLSHVVDEVNDTLAVTPFIVVPRHQLQGALHIRESTANNAKL